MDIVAKIGPLETLAVGNTGPIRPETIKDPEEVDKGTPFLAEITVPEAEDSEGNIPLTDEETEDPRGLVEARLELEARTGDDGYPPFVKFAHVMIVLLA